LLVFLTKNDELLDRLQSEPFFSERRNEAILNRLTYSVNDSFAKNCTGILFEDSDYKRGLIAFLCDAYKHKDYYVILPCILQDLAYLSSICKDKDSHAPELLLRSDVDVGNEQRYLYKTSADYFIKLTRHAIENDFTMAAMSGDTQLEKLKEVVQESFGFSFLTEINKLEIFEWIFLSGFSYGDSNYQIFATRNGMLLQDIMERIGTDRIISKCVACF
jgi:hypothetical protein